MTPAAALDTLLPQEPNAEPQARPRFQPLPQVRQRWWTLTLTFVGFCTLARLLIISTTNIADGEAYYDLWARFPSLSYYDHPPLVAWMTWIFSRLDRTDFTVRLAPVLCAGAFNLLVYKLTERLFSPRAGFFATLIVAALPAFIITGFVLNPESPLAPLWVLGLLCLEGMRDGDEAWRPLAAGLVVGLAFLAKYTGILLVPMAVIYLAASPRARRWLRRPSFYLAGVTALVVASPVILWNAPRHWPSLTLHFVERVGSTDALTLLRNAALVAAGQLGAFHPLLSPFLFAALGLAVYRGFGRGFGRGNSANDDRYRFLACAAVPVLLFLFGAMIRVKDPEVHWTMVGYVPLAIAAAGYLDENGPRARLLRHWILRPGLALSAAAYVLVFVYSQTLTLPRFVLDHGYNPNSDVFNETVGFDELREAIQTAAGGLGANTVVAGPQYAFCAHMAWALDDEPKVYCPSLRRTEFDFLGRRNPPPGAPVLYVNNDHYPDEPAALLPERTCLPLQTVSIERAGRVLRHYQLYGCAPVDQPGSIVARTGAPVPKSE